MTAENVSKLNNAVLYCERQGKIFVNVCGLDFIDRPSIMAHDAPTDSSLATILTHYKNYTTDYNSIQFIYVTISNL